MVRASATPLSIPVIAQHLGVHVNTIRFHLDALTAAGRVEKVLGDIAGPGRPPILYRGRRDMDRTGPSNYKLLATMLTSHLAATGSTAAATATELGRNWGPYLIGPSAPASTTSSSAAVARLTALLDELGFDPDTTSSPPVNQIRLRHCPFLDLVGDHGDIICALHLGLMQGAMTALTDGVAVERLDPFVEPNLCIAHLRVTATDGGRSRSGARIDVPAPAASRRRFPPSGHAHPATER
nr:hypothetical protein [Nakamurella panacisegetis]